MVEGDQELNQDQYIDAQRHRRESKLKISGGGYLEINFV